MQEQELEGKWGRHRCRPHSHRRVDLPCGGCLTPLARPQMGCGAVARRSRRCRIGWRTGCGLATSPSSLRRVRSLVPTLACRSDRLRHARGRGESIGGWQCGCLALRRCNSVVLSAGLRDCPCGWFPLPCSLRPVLHRPHRSLPSVPACPDRLAIYPGGFPFPLSISGRCARAVSRASRQPATYPLLAKWLVDKGGQVNGPSQGRAVGRDQRCLRLSACGRGWRGGAGAGR